MRKLFYCFLSFWSPIARYWYRNRLRVLAYHEVPDPIAFEKQLQHLKAKYSIISISQLDEYLYSKEKTNILPEYPLLLTFDDGIYDVKENGFPLLKKYKIPACVFVVTEAINSNREFWWDTVASIMAKEGKNNTEIRSYLNSLKKVPNRERRKVKEETTPVFGKQLTSEYLRDFEEANIKIGNHSHTHPMFNQCETEEIILELDNSKRCFQDWQVGSFEYFAYPNGNHSLKAEKILKEYGVKLAFLFEHKVNEKELNPLRIARIAANSYMNLSELKAKVSGVHSFYVHFVARLKGNKK